MEDRDTPYFRALREKQRRDLIRSRARDRGLNVGGLVPERRVRREGFGFFSRARAFISSRIGRRRERRLEYYVVFFVYLVVGVFAVYFLVLNFAPERFNSWELSAGDKMIGSDFKSFYLRDVDALGGVARLNVLCDEGGCEETSARMVVWEKPFEFVFNPKSKFGGDEVFGVELGFVRPETEVYLNEELIVPDLSGLERVFDKGGRSVWVRESLVSERRSKGEEVGGKGEDYSSAEDFVYGEFLNRDYYVFGDAFASYPVLSDYDKGSESVVDGRFRGNLRLAVYVEGDLSVDFVKRDLNWYLGRDEYTVEVSGLDGEVYFREVFLDDGEMRKGNGGDEQRFGFVVDNLSRGIYYVDFLRDENNEHSDSSVGDIKVNSNKVLIRFLLMGMVFWLIDILGLLFWILFLRGSVMFLWIGFLLVSLGIFREIFWVI